MPTPQYICHNNTCAIAISKATFPSGMNCPVCKEPLKEVLENNQTVQLSDHEQMIVDNYPYVVAYPFSKMLLETHPLAKINLLKDTLQNTLKYIALLLATEYFESHLKNESINALFKDNLQRPSFGNWNHFIRETLKELHKEDHTFFIKELPEFYNKVEVGKAKKYKIVKKVTNDLGLIENRKDSMTAIRALIYFRNKELGHGMTWPDKKNKELYETYYPILRDLLVAMNFAVRYPMYKYDKGSKWELTGTSISMFDTAEVKSHEDTKHLWVENKNGEALFLAPFFILPKSYITDVPDEVEVFVYEEYTGSRLIFFSPENAKGETSGAILRELQLLLENKISKNAYIKETLNVTLIIDQITKQNDRVLKELRTERKVLPGIYQERQDAEVALRSWIGSIYGLFLVSATAGSGKTNLMVEMQNQYEQRNLAAVLLRANRIKSTNIELVLKKTLDLDVNYDFNDLKALGFSQDNPLMVLIDGGNEHNTPGAFLQGVLQFLKKQTGGFIKVILSWRADLKSELPVIEDVYEALVYTEKEDGTQAHLLAKKAYVLTPLNKKELESAWIVYTKDKSKQYKPKFSLEELTYFDRKLADDLHNPLHLKLFLELFHNKGMPKNQGFFNLWEAYGKQLKKHKEQYTLLLLLIELMFDKQMHALPSALVYEVPSISVYIHNKDISGPYEQLKRKGILAEYYQDNERYIAFAVEAFYHFILGEMLGQKFKNKPNEELLILLKAHKLKGIQNGLQQCLLLDIDQQNYSRLIWLIDNSEEEQLSYYALPLAQAFIQYDVTSVFEKLFEKSTDNDIEMLTDSISILENNGLYEIISEVCVVINSQINPTCTLTINLLMKAVSYLNPEGGKTLLNNIKGIITSELIIKKESDLVNICNAIANVSIEMGEFNDALYYYEKSLEVNLMKLGASHPNTSINFYHIGRAFYNKGNFNKALEFIEKSLESRSEALEEDPMHFSANFNYLGMILGDKAEYNRALKYHEKSLKIRIKHFGLHHPYTATSYHNMGVIYWGKEEHNTALKYYEKSLSINLKTFGDSHSKTAVNFGSIGLVWRDIGDLDKALEYHEKSLLTNLKYYGKNHPRVGWNYNNIGLVLFDRKEYEKALEYYEKGLIIDIDNYGEMTPQVAAVYNNIALIWREKKDYYKAIQYFEKTLIIRNEMLGIQHPDTVLSNYNIGVLSNKLNDYKAAIKHFKLCWKHNREKQGGPAYGLYESYQALNQTKDALHWLEQAALAREDDLGLTHESTQNTITELIAYAKEHDELKMVEQWGQRIRENK